MRLFWIVTLCVGLLSFAGHAARAENNPVVGVFDGVIWSNGESRGVTQFYLKANQKLAARYQYEALTEHGVLDHCVRKARLVRCIWQDSYGSGDFIAKFNADFTSFSGKWFEETHSGARRMSDPDGLLWTGQKVK